jgi:hypothetical protein
LTQSEHNPHLVHFNKSMLEVAKNISAQLALTKPSPEMFSWIANQTENAQRIKGLFPAVFQIPNLSLAIKPFAMPNLGLPSFSGISKIIEDSMLAFKAQAPIFREFAESFQLLPPKLQAALITLGQHGWYMDLEMSLPDLWRLEGDLLEGRLEEAKAFLCDYFESSLDETQTRLAKWLPERGAILKSAFDAHQRIGKT